MGVYSYRLDFYAISANLSFNLISSNQELLEEFRNELLLIFSSVDYESETITVQALQMNSEATILKIEEIIQEYIDRFSPSINQIIAFFRKLEKNEYFYFLPNISQNLDQKDKYSLLNHLKSLRENKDSLSVQSQFNELYEDFFDKYLVFSYGRERVTIGEKVKLKRICRFCNQSIPQTTFKRKAHAISEALGNKNVLLFEECDVCNDQFSRTIEPDIVTYMSLFRTFFDIKGKGGSKEFKGRNFNVKIDKQINLILKNMPDNDVSEDLPNNIKLDVGMISLQNIYKCLCKFCLSVIDSDLLPHFKQTMDWINGNKKVHNLPKIAEMISYVGFNTHPRLNLYVRKAGEPDIPFLVGEFHFTCKIIVFIVPFSNIDEVDFLTKDSYNTFWRSFPQYYKTKEWIFDDFSALDPKEYAININIKKTTN